MSTRVYLPLTIALLAELHAAGEVDRDRRRRRGAEDDSEEAEYAALMTAADASAALLDGPGRRVVVVAELEKEPEPGWTIPLRRSSPCTPTPRTARPTPTPTRTSPGSRTQEIPHLL